MIIPKDIIDHCQTRNPNTAKTPTDKTVKGKYACQNRPAVDKMTAYGAQDGWKDGKRVEVVVRTRWNGKGCKYDESARQRDAKCVGCCWRTRQ